MYKNEQEEIKDDQSANEQEEVPKNQPTNSDLPYGTLDKKVKTDYNNKQRRRIQRHTRYQ